MIKDQIIKNINPLGLLNREQFMDMVERNSKPYRQLMSFYNCALMEVETKFKVLNEEMSIDSERNPIESIKTRIKSIDGIVRKMNKKGISLDIDEIEKNISDIAGIRVVCSFPEDIYFLEECLLKQDDIRLIERKDYIKNPKESGYRSLHLIVEVPIFLQNEKRWMKVEIQLRTIAMDFWASLEHKLRYKKDLSPVLQSQLKQDLLDCSNDIAALDEKMETIRKHIEDFK